jgi:CHASE1-domain containing sensor protein
VPVVSLAAAVIGVALSLLAWQVSLQREDRLARQDFDALASDRFVLLQNGIDQYVNDIAALRAVFQAFEPGIDRQQFRRFSDDLFRDKNAILSASWAPRVTRDQRADFEIKATRDGLAGYRIKSIAADGTLSTAGEAAEYFPVFYLSKGEPGTTVYGIDINDGDIRQRALERARDEDRAAATANFVLRRGVGDRTGFLVVLPVYKPGLPHDTVADRRRNLSGFVQGVFQIGVMIDTILQTTTTPKGLDGYFFAADSPADAAPFYFHRSRARAEPSAPRSREAIEQGLHWSGELKVADRHWTYVAAPTPGGPGNTKHFSSWLVLIGGLSISFILAAYLWNVGRSARRLQRANETLDRAIGDLDAANERLRTQNARFDTALNNMSQGLGFFYGEQRLIVCNRRLSEMYGLPPDRLVPGITLAEIIDLRWEAGSVPSMSKEDYLLWRSSFSVSDQVTDTTVELENGRTIRIRRQPMPDGGWVATHEDITEHRRSEKALAEARVNAERAQQDAQAAHARLVEAFEVVPQGIAMMDADDRLVLWNNQYAETYRVTGEAIAAGMRFEDILRSGSCERPVCRCRRQGRRMAGRTARRARAAVEPARTTPVVGSLHRRRRAANRERREHRSPHRHHRHQAA